MNIILIGSGGREHAIAWSLARSPLVKKIVVVPGNGGTASEAKCKNIDISSCGYIENNGVSPYVQIARREECIMAVIGPENPLAEGLADVFWKADIPCIGAKKQAAALEASKDFAKRFMRTYGVACAKSETFDDSKKAKAYVTQHGAPVVIKADGLAAGKGVVVAASVEDALAAISDIMDSGKVGAAGKKIVIEEYLEGVEISVLAAVSVTTEAAKNRRAKIVPFLPARDHKRLFDGAAGPNTGGMGAVCPLADVTDETMTARYSFADAQGSHRRKLRLPRFYFFRRHAHKKRSEASRIQRTARRPRNAGASSARRFRLRRNVLFDRQLFA